MNSTSTTSIACGLCAGAAIIPTSDSAASTSAQNRTDTFDTRSPRKPPPMPPTGRIHSLSVVMKPAAVALSPKLPSCRYAEKL